MLPSMSTLQRLLILGTATICIVTLFQIEYLRNLRYENKMLKELESEVIKEGGKCTDKVWRHTLSGMSSAEVKAFRRSLQNKTSYFEYGSGGSTGVAPFVMGWSDSKLVHCISIEPSTQWGLWMLKEDRIQCLRDAGVLDYRITSPSTTRRWARPNKDAWPLWNVYWNATAIIADEAHRRHDGPWDVVLVDGRFRVACALAAIPHVKPKDGLILVHDYDRSAYWELEDFLRPQTWAGDTGDWVDCDCSLGRPHQQCGTERLVVFKVKENYVSKKLEDAIQRFRMTAQ